MQRKRMILRHGEIAWEIAPGADGAGPATGNAPFAAARSVETPATPSVVASTAPPEPPLSPAAPAAPADIELTSPAPAKLIAAATLAPPPILPVITLHGVEIHA